MNPFIHNIVAEAVRDQPWYKRNANTIVAGLTLLGAVLSFIVSLGLDLPTMVASALPVAVTAIGTLVTKLTRNGVQPSTEGALSGTPTARGTLPGSPVVAAEKARTYVGAHRAQG